jgi:acyl-coenzyme A thioesterase PaaI-like protein
MPETSARSVAAAALRDLSHALVAHEPDDEALLALAADVRAYTATLDAAPNRDRLALMRASAQDGSVFGAEDRSGFADRAVAGRDNPGAIDIEVMFEPDEVVAHVVLRRAFEGAPGRAHGGIVAAAFDDVTGFVIGFAGEPAFTGELTVRYVAPVPIEQTLVMRARLTGRERRKLFIEAEAHAGEQLVATCKATYITVDPTMFAGAPDPR